MRCPGMATFSRCAWPLVLTLSAGPSAFAESFACYPVQRGDTASRLANRITGDASNEYRPWFDIVDRSGRSVPKSQYDRVRSGWRACVPVKTVEHRPLEARRVVIDKAATPVEGAPSPPAANAPRTTQDVFGPSVVALQGSLNLDPTRIWLGAVVAVPTLGFLILGGYIQRRGTAGIFMSQFAYLFVREFERPLV